MSSQQLSGPILALAERYRSAFVRVQQRLTLVKDLPVDAWVFNLDRLKLEDIHAVDAELGLLEEHRRQVRAALHALTELHALDGEGAGLEDDQDARSTFERLDGAGEDRRQLDRFMTVVNAARDAGCIYVNHTFQPAMGYDDPGRASPPSAAR
jgi:hypothetical protein